VIESKRLNLLKIKNHQYYQIKKNNNEWETLPVLDYFKYEE
jgi:serine/threonine protein phosphatase 1